MQDALFLKFGRCVCCKPSAHRCVNARAVFSGARNGSDAHVDNGCRLVRVVDDPSEACVLVAAPEEVDRTKGGTLPLHKGQYWI